MLLGVLRCGRERPRFVHKALIVHTCMLALRMSAIIRVLSSHAGYGQIVLDCSAQVQPLWLLA